MICSSVVSRGGAAAARRAHNPEVVGSNPTPATMEILGRLVRPEIFIFMKGLVDDVGTAIREYKGYIYIPTLA